MRSNQAGLTLEILVIFSLLRRSFSCNALDNPELLEVSDSFPSFSSEVISGEDRSVEVVFPSKLEGSSVRLVEVDAEDGSGDVSGSLWLREKRRLGDGFTAEFQFSIDGASDGLAFVVQNDKIQDIQGSLGDSLGFKNGLDKFIAVTLDVCVDRLACLGDIKVTVITEPDIVHSSISLPPTAVNKDGGVVHVMKVTYAALTNVVRVELDGSLVLQDALVGVTAADIFDSRFAFLGFTSSNLGSAPANIDVHSLTVAKFNSEARLRDGIVPKEVQIGTDQAVGVEFVDPCNAPSAQLIAVNNISAGSFQAKLVLQSSTSPIEFAPGAITQVSATTFELVFNIAFLGDYTLEVEIEGVQVQATPLAVAFIGVDRLELPPYAIALLASLLSILVLASIFAVRRFVIYRSKLKEYKEAIEGGIEAARLRDLEKDVDWSGISPLMGDLAVLKQQLKKNKEELRRLRNRTAPLGDGEQTLAQLKNENAKLVKRLNDIKRRKQMQEAFTPRRTLLAFVPIARRREIAQESVREGRATRIREKEKLFRARLDSEEKEDDVKESIEQEI